MRQIVITLNDDLPTPAVEWKDDGQAITPREVNIVQRTLRVQYSLYTRNMRLKSRLNAKELADAS